MCYAKHITVEPVPRYCVYNLFSYQVILYIHEWTYLCYSYKCYRYKLEVLATDEKFKSKFIFWDIDCMKLIGKSIVQMKMDCIEVYNLTFLGLCPLQPMFHKYFLLIQTIEDNLLDFPYELDGELAIRAIFLLKNDRLSVIGLKNDEDTRKKIRESFKSGEVIFVIHSLYNIID